MVPLWHICFFADNLLLLAEAASGQARVINTVFENFCNSFEAKVNKTKTQVFFSKNISERERNRIGRMLGFITKDLGKYLGMPLLHPRVSKSTYQDILDKMEKKALWMECFPLILRSPDNDSPIYFASSPYLCNAVNRPSCRDKAEDRPSMQAFHMEWCCNFSKTKYG